MSVKPYIFLGLLAVTVAGAAVPGVSYAQNKSTDTAIILAQNESGKQRGFLGRLFNGSDKKPSATPLFLNKSRGSGAKPYNYSGRRDISSRRSKLDRDKKWDDFKFAQEAGIAEQTGRAKMAGRAARDRIRMARNERRAMQSRNSKASGADSNKIMVYDPRKAWTYDPNKPRDPEEKRSRIFNTR